MPEPVVYAGLGIGAALENVVPPVPADTFVLLGGFLAALGDVSATGVFVSTWLCNVASALVMYRIGYAHGRSFFQVGYGRHLLNDRQMRRMGGFYDRWGTTAIFFTRFLPGLRSVVPIFAGVTRQRFVPVAAPIAAASALWYGGLVWAGTVAGQNLDFVRGAVADVNALLLVVAGAIALALAIWWVRTR